MLGALECQIAVVASNFDLNQDIALQGCCPKTGYRQVGASANQFPGIIMATFERPATAILHATDFSPASERAFAHALAIALANQARLTVLHVTGDANDEVPWHDYPAVRNTLERWGKIEPGTPRSAVGSQLGIRVEKMVGVGKDVAKVIAGLTKLKHFDLIVMASGDRQHPFWAKSAVSLPVAEHTKLPVLFVPESGRGSVSMEDGTTRLKQVVIAVDHKPDAQPALGRTALALERFGGDDSQVTLLHIGSEDAFPEVHPPVYGNFRWSKTVRQGKPSREIVGVAEALSADLIVMITDWKRDFWDVLSGSTVEQVVKHAPCPVFTMPADEEKDD
jgi:nucleotide-binding universal stress UspA family protein